MERKGKTTMMKGLGMAMDALDCPICHEPLEPPIYQCRRSHLMCKSCRTLKENNKCPSPLCATTVFIRCLGMERIAEAIEAPCCFAKNGCTEKMAYFKKAAHEKACPHGPCFCPEPGCGFSGSAAALRAHLAGGRHRWAATAFEYYAPFDLRVRPGPHVLHAQDGTSVFVMNVVAVPAEQHLVGGHVHAISIVYVQPEEVASSSKRPKFGLSLVFSCFAGQHQVLTLEEVRSSSLADGLPKDVLCFVPARASGGHDDDDVVLSITIQTELAFDDDEKLEDDNSRDKDYDENDEEEESKDDDEEEEVEGDDDDENGEEDDEEENDDEMEEEEDDE